MLETGLRKKQIFSSDTGGESIPENWQQQNMYIWEPAEGKGQVHRKGERIKSREVVESNSLK